MTSIKELCGITDEVINDVSLDAIQGDWKVVSLGRNGRFAPESHLASANMTFSISGRQFENLAESGTLELEKVTSSTSELPEAVVTHMDQRGSTGDLHKCIVRLVNGQMEVCQAEVGKPRPVDFKRKRKDGASLVRFEKVLAENLDLSISMVPLSDQPALSLVKVQAALSHRWPDFSSLKSPVDGKDQITFDVGESQVIVALMPAPVPAGDVHSACQQSPYWHMASDDLKSQVAHAIVSVFGEPQPFSRQMILSQVTCAVLDSHESALGVLWCGSGAVFPKEMFQQAITENSPSDYPTSLWVNIQVGTNENGTSSGHTSGMNSLGHREFETTAGTEPPSELRGRLAGLVDHVLENGPVFKDGDTVGESESEKILMLHLGSQFGKLGSVIRLVYPNAHEFIQSKLNPSTATSESSGPEKQEVSLPAVCTVLGIVVLGVFVFSGFDILSTAMVGVSGLMGIGYVLYIKYVAKVSARNRQEAESKKNRYKL